MTNTVAVIDYGMGNLHSVGKALEHVAPQARVQITDDPHTILQADRVILPGVGAIRDCVGEIRRLGFDEVVHEAARTRPLLGICVGMQAMMAHSEENNGVNCLGLFPGEVKWFNAPRDAAGDPMKVPHMGWNQVWQSQPHPLWQGIEDGSRFYFVHSYYVAPDDANLYAGRSEYDVTFAAAIARDNVFAVQFHPEKSHTSGLKLLQNFMAWQP